MPRNRNQRGGASTDWAPSFYARSVVGGPAAITRAGLTMIDKAPMFNPLSQNTVFPTETSGIIPNGLYLASEPPLVTAPAATPTEVSSTAVPHVQIGGGQRAQRAQRGGCCGQIGGGDLLKMPVTELRSLCNQMGASARDSDGHLLPKPMLVARIQASGNR